MPESTPSTSQTPSNYKDALPPGTYIGVVKNNVDPSRSGRLQVYIQNRGSANPENKDNWTTVIYCPPFYGTTPIGAQAGTGAFEQGNPQSYGMWFTPPDLGTQVLIMQVKGEPMAYYVGCVPTQYASHMVPAIGAVPKAQAVTQNSSQASYLGNSTRLPVTEINVTDTKISQNPKFFDQPKPVHSYVAGILFQQGLIDDQVRGTIGSSSQRESPSNCYGISTPGRAIYLGGIGAGAGGEESINTTDLKSKQPSAAKVIARRGGHTFVMDDGDLKGKDNLVRIRTAKGHQITMSDDGDCFYICHANGQAWIELGQEGTLDVYTTNSVNLRSQGTINLHADEDINMFAGGSLNIKSTKDTIFQSDGDIALSNKGSMTLFSQGKVGIKSPGTVAISSQLGSWACNGSLSFNGDKLQLNGGPKTEVEAPAGLTKYLHPKVEFNASSGWIAIPSATESIVTRAPTHEPYPYHNQGVSVSVKFSGAPTPPPDAPPVPKDVKITKTGDAATTAAKATAAAATSPEPPTINLSSVSWDPRNRDSIKAASDYVASQAEILKAWYNQYGSTATQEQRTKISSQLNAVIALQQALKADIDALNGR